MIDKIWLSMCSLCGGFGYSCKLGVRRVCMYCDGTGLTRESMSFLTAEFSCEFSLAAVVEQCPAYRVYAHILEPCPSHRI